MKQMLRATKTSLYRLVSEHETLPIMKRTRFIKHRRSFWLRWHDDDADYEAYFTVCAGSPMLAIKRRKFDSDDPSTRYVTRYTTDYLRSLGMIEEIPKPSISQAVQANN